MYSTGFDCTVIQGGAFSAVLQKLWLSALKMPSMIDRFIKNKIQT